MTEHRRVDVDVAPSGQPQRRPAKPATASDQALGAQLVPAGLLLILVFAPLFSGGYAPSALLVLQWLGLALLVAVVWQPRPLTLRWAEWVFLGLLFVLPLLYLLPLPAWLAQWLPARELYAEARALAGEEALAATRLSIYPFATEAAWLMLVLPIGVYIAARSLSESQQFRLIYVFFGVVLVQVLIALFQFATDSGMQYSLVDLLDRGGASGTYLNRNHLAGMIELALPLVLAMFFYDFGGRIQTSARRSGLRKRLASLLQWSNRPSWLFVLLAVLLTVGVIVTRSRTGILMVMVGILVATILFSRRLGGRGSVGLIGQLITISVGVAIFLGLAPVLDRFSVAEMEGDARWPIAVATFDAAGRLLPFGSGPGTYQDVFELYQPIELGRWVINYAHNDYLQVFFELGLAGLVLIGAFLMLYLAQWPRLLKAEDWSRYRSLQIGAGIALLLLLGHSFTDNNLRNPANMAYFAMVAAVFFSAPGMPRLSDLPRKRKRRALTLEESGIVGAGSAATDTAAGGASTPARPRSPNPFDD
ncbi:O-antigen ligase family protein [Thiocapsa sp. UBA6158]|jgi:O-antigen ligase|uniref:O-antigen ligase family protein n=1 Tax=Thiocapsa sp. UBA6158 TaxID=1947692 RepID=UPI0025DAB4BC|nr:O-antigen ligase family protein [Thiocapsa sp. UBA6158]